MIPRRVTLLTGLAGVALLAGCARQFTRDRFDMLEKSVDTREDVRRILG